MFDGVAYDAGQEFRVGKAVFFFAASKLLREIVGLEKNEKNEKNENKNKAYSTWINERRDEEKKIFESIADDGTKEKLLDFLDRMDEFVYLPPVEVVPFNNEGQSQQLIQAELIVANLILKHFPEVEFVERLALAVLSHNILDSNSRRKVISSLLNSITPVDKIFRILNLPKSCLDKNEGLISKIRENYLKNDEELQKKGNPPKEKLLRIISTKDDFV